MYAYNFASLEELFGQQRLQLKATRDYKLLFRQNRIEINTAGSSLSYKRFVGSELMVEAMIVSDEDPIVIGVFPNPPLFTPAAVARNVYLRFKTPVIVDQRSQAVIYAKMPIEIGIYRQSKDEEILIDSFSYVGPQYALYGAPESGVVCRYTETEISTSNDNIKPAKYEEALVRVKITNDIDNVVRISKVIVPMDGVVMDHAHDDSWLPGTVEMGLNTSFGKNIVHVRLTNTKVKRSDKTSIRAKKQETLVFLMDAGY
jgi:uncharacterized protein